MESVSYELDGDVAVVRLDDGKANALSPAVIEALEAAADRAEREASALVLLGREKRLSAGFDLTVMSGEVEAMRALVVAGGELMVRLYLSPVPVVVGCTGHALAAGAILLLSSDYRVGADGAFKIGLNEVAIQMTLPSFGVELGRDRLAKRHFTQAVTQARIYDPAGAVEAGYLDEVVPPDQVVAVALEHGRRLAQLPRSSFHGTKLKERGPTAENVRRGIVADIAALTKG